MIKKNKNKNILKINEDYFNLIKNNLKFKEFDEKNIISQLGTLGGGNHFIEIGIGKDNNIWIIIHSGSRGFGYKIAEYYIRKAEQVNVNDNEEINNNFRLSLASELGKDYLNDMNIALNFALENRKKMIYKIVNILNNPEELYFINRNHNHAELIIENNKK
jgi:tRNA-splicing ligase RtcB